VVRELHTYSGTQFDPVAVNAMLALLEREGEGFLRKSQTFDIYEFIEG
jgi:HD-GYP domain-containing protein (c-di-GMP phosphodiesterase class II)